MQLFSIFDTPKNFNKLHPLFERALNYIREHLDNPNPNGKYELGSGMFAIFDEYHPKPISAGEFENHHKYIDIQVLVRGEEWIFLGLGFNASIVDNDIARQKKYSDEKDIEFIVPKNVKNYCLENSTRLIMKKGIIAVFWPGDWHMPCIEPSLNIRLEKDENLGLEEELNLNLESIKILKTVKKIVIKIPFNL